MILLLLEGLDDPCVVALASALAGSWSGFGTNKSEDVGMSRSLGQSCGCFLRE
jgi:hypothetical protein